MLLMLDELKRLDVVMSQCHGKIFGGGDMFPERTHGDMQKIGTRNGEAARALLRAHRIHAVSESLFGVGHRQIIFDIGSGHVWSRQVKPVDNGT